MHKGAGHHLPHRLCPRAAQAPGWRGTDFNTSQLCEPPRRRLVLLRDMEDLVELVDVAGLPKLLAFLNDEGPWFPCNQSWGFETANESNLGPPRFE